MDSYHAKATTGGVLPALVSKCRTSQLVPESFFIAWNGVLVLVFRKFTSSILSLKAEIDSSLESVICKENPGSKYPKSTIAALADNEQLSLEEFTKLRLLALSYRDKYVSLSPRALLHEIRTRLSLIPVNVSLPIFVLCVPYCLLSADYQR